MRRNQGLIQWYIRAYRGLPVDPEDLFQEGAIALLDVIRCKFDPDRRFKLATYAGPFIHAAIAKSVRYHGVICVSEYGVKKINELRRTSSVLSDRLGRRPALEDLAAKLNWSEDQIRKVYHWQESRNVASLEELQSTACGDECLGMDDPDVVLKVALAQALQKLNERDRLIIYYRYFVQETQIEVGKRLKYSQSKVHRLELAALSELRGCLEGGDLGDAKESGGNR